METKEETMLRRSMPFLLCLLFAPLWLFAQEVANPAPNPIEIGARAIEALTPVLTVVVLWAFKLGWSKIPASFVLFAAPVVGMAVNYGVSYIAGHPSANLLIAAVLGAVSTYLREIGSTLATKGLTGPVTITKLNF